MEGTVEGATAKLSSSTISLQPRVSGQNCGQTNLPAVLDDGYPSSFFPLFRRASKLLQQVDVHSQLDGYKIILDFYKEKRH